MREIKFRAYHTANKVMIENKNLSVLAKNIKDDNVWKFMQYTGLKDDNGIEVYEGDILQFGAQMGSTSVVKWIQRNAGFEVKDRWGDWQWLYDVLASTNAKVIGNIHENPELLK